MTSAPYNVVFAGNGSDVVLTLCDGQVVYERSADGTEAWNGVDVEKAKAEAAQRAARIIAEL